MIKKIVIVLLLAAGIGYYFFAYPPVVKKRATAKALEQFSLAVETKDRAKIGEALKNFLTDDAKVRLEISFFSIIPNNNPPMVQDFDKPQFITFLDNTLYPLSDYAYYAELTNFKLADDKQSAQVLFASKEWGDGANYYGGNAVQMRFSSVTGCEGAVRFAGEKPQLANVVCKLQFRAVPKPEEIGKMQGNMDVMKDYLIKQ